MGAVACVLPRRNGILVDWSTELQTIDGFGAASNETSFPEPLPDSVTDFFYTSSGIGLTLLRNRSYPSVADCEHDSKVGYCVPSPSGTLLSDLGSPKSDGERSHGVGQPMESGRDR